MNKRPLTMIDVSSLANCLQNQTKSICLCWKQSNCLAFIIWSYIKSKSKSFEYTISLYILFTLHWCHKLCIYPWYFYRIKVVGSGVPSIVSSQESINVKSRNWAGLGVGRLMFIFFLLSYIVMWGHQDTRLTNKGPGGRWELQIR